MKPSALQLITEEVRRFKNLLNSKKVSSGMAAEESGFAQARLAAAAAVLDHAPYLREKIMSGGMNIQDAAKEARAKKRLGEALLRFADEHRKNYPPGWGAP